MKTWLGWLPAMMVAVTTLLVGPAWADKRVALVVGVSDYKVGGKLPQTLIDAGKIGAALSARGFSVTTLDKPDLTKSELEQALLEFSISADRADVAVLYFAGHGMQHGDDNWLIPASAELRAESHIRFEGVSLQNVVELMRTARFRIIVLDACRNNPFVVNWGATMSTGEGLGMVAQAAMPAGSLVAFSAAPGQKVPNDGLYAEALAKWIGAEGIELRQALDRVRRDVQQKNPAAAPEYVPRYDGAFSFSTGYIETPGILDVPFLDARATTSTVRAPLISVDPKMLPDFALFRECEGCPEMVILPAGTFTMGADDGEQNEKPVRQVSIRRFAISRFETTWDDWDTCVAAGSCRGAGPQGAGGDNGWGKGRRPVIEVDWNDAQAFARLATSQTNADYRLPSEAEWEYAARAGSVEKYAWGALDPVCDEQAPNGANFASCADQRTRPVGSFVSNLFGLFDVHGNVMEWVEDCYMDNYAAGQTNDGKPFTKGLCEILVARGGSWWDGPEHLRSANRDGDRSTGRYDFIGFRVARTL